MESYILLCLSYGNFFHFITFLKQICTIILTRIDENVIKIIFINYKIIFIIMHIYNT